MAIALVVTAPFGDYGKGDHITDEAAIAKALADRPHDVVRMTVPDHVAAPAPNPMIAGAAQLEVEQH